MAAKKPPAPEEFNVRLRLRVLPKASPRRPARLAISGEDGSEALALEIRTDRLRLFTRTTSAPRRAWQGSCSLEPGTHTVVLKHRPGRLAVCLDNTQLTAVRYVGIAGKASARFAGTDHLQASGRIRVQRLGEIALADDFAREGAANTPLWEVFTGRFAVNTSLNPGSSQSAFQLCGSAPDGRGVTVSNSSYWFWDEYRLGVSAQVTALPSAWGLVFHVTDPDNYHVLRWRQQGDGNGTLEMARRRLGHDTVLATRALPLRPGQWQRATVVIRGTTAHAYVNGVLMLVQRDPCLVGGKAGLLVEGANPVFFDDLTVNSLKPRPETDTSGLPQPFGPCEQRWSSFAGKRFVTDRYMMHWSQPRSFWQRGTAESTALHWFRTRIFHDAAFSWQKSQGVACHWPRQPLDIVLFGERNTPTAGYGIRLEGRNIRLTRDGVLAAEHPLEATSLESISLSVDAGTVSCSVNGADVLAWTDPNPLTQGEVGADIGPVRGSSHRPDWRDTATIESSHRLDYSFDHAPTAWDVRSGRWRGTHRWACVPRWSFFGGRGDPGAPGTDVGNALLWSRRRFRGDFDFECFAAPMEGTPQRVHFSWPVSVNLAFCNDGTNLDSGYALLFGLYDLPTRLYRAGKEVAAWNKRVDPDLRCRPMPWYHRVTQVWQHLRVTRRGTRITVDAGRHDNDGNYLDLERVFDYEDSTPLSGEHIALWTWGANGMAVARATVSFAESPGVAAMAPAGRDGAEGVHITHHSAGDGEPKAFRRVTNLRPGGTFCHELLTAPHDLRSQGVLELDLRTDHPLSLSLLGSARGHTVEAVLCGMPSTRPDTIGLCPQALIGPGRAGQWQHVRIDVAGALARAFPSGPLTLDRLTLGSQYRTIEEIAGLGVNRAGAAYDLADVRWSRSTAATTTAPPGVRVRIHDAYPLDDFETGMAGWTRLGGWDGAALYRDPGSAADGGTSLRLVNQTVAGPAGAWVTRQPYDLARFPLLAFEYRIPRGVEINLVLQANGRWFEGQFTGNDSSWPVIGRFDKVETDGTWHAARFDLRAALERRLPAGTVTVDRLALADSWRMTTWQGNAYWIDNFCRVPAVSAADGAVVTLEPVGAGRITAYAHVVDEEPGTVPPPTPTGEGHDLHLRASEGEHYLHVRTQFESGAWSAPCHLPFVVTAVTAASITAQPEPAADAGPPAAPRVSYIPSDSLCRDDFEWERSPEFPEKLLGETCIRREAWVLRVEDDGATGSGCVEFVNLSQDGFFSGYFRKSAWDPQRWPKVSFDYKFEQPRCSLNLSMLANEAMTIVEWTGRNRHGNYFADSVIGRTEPAVQDGQWHHTEFDLRDMLLKTRFSDAERRGPIAVTELATWSTSHWNGGAYNNPLGARVRVDNFTIHSDDGTSPAFEWKVPGTAAPMKGYSCLWDRQTDSVPPAEVTTTANRAQYRDVEAGEWFFHVRACDRHDRWSPPAHRRVTIAP